MDILWTFLGQLESNRFEAVKTRLPCRPGDAIDILMGKPQHQASIKSQLPRGQASAAPSWIGVEILDRIHRTRTESLTPC